MYPDKTWKPISKAAINCIQHFLVVKQDARYTVDQALADPWMIDKQCLEDIGRLEEEAIFIGKFHKIFKHFQFLYLDWSSVAH